MDPDIVQNIKTAENINCFNAQVYFLQACIFKTTLKT